MPAVFLWTTLPFAAATVCLALLTQRLSKVVLWLVALGVGLLFGAIFYLLWQQSGPDRRLQELGTFLVMYAIPMVPAAAGLSRLKDQRRVSIASVGTVALLSALIGFGWCFLIYVQGCRFGWTECP